MNRLQVLIVVNNQTLSKRMVLCATGNPRFQEGKILSRTLWEGFGISLFCFFQNAEDVKNDRMSNQILSINSGDAHSMSSEELASLPLQVGDLFSSPPTHLVATYSLLHLLT